MDVDTGVDDALALALAASLPKVSLDAITVAAGNTDLSNAYDNTLRTLNVLNRTDVPVYMGADRPIDSSLEYEDTYFGPDNFGGASSLYAAGANSAADPDTPAYLKMIELAKKKPGRRTMVLTAPLTNVAIALLVDPDFLEDVEHIYILGGTLYGKGNALPAVDFNFFSDPEAALVVLQRAACPVTIIPWEAVLHATVPWSTYYGIANKTGPLQTFLRDITTHTVRCCLSGGQSPGFNVGDFLAVLAAAVPESVASVLVQRVDVELAGAYTRGQLVHAWQPDMLPHVKRNVTLVRRFDVDFVEKYFKRAFDPSSG
ncbi:hypothetical protein V5799_032057 [Amblyomma americanum]|uniref:Inosine/uridine-preferring nucleoside hydrolase domain-containing protein n=1 Tax=Amblyomma americanum TaxID=6943 RepID=A0AAQ4DS92_AMBAM